jgi:hypothetical protein
MLLKYVKGTEVVHEVSLPIDLRDLARILDRLYHPSSSPGLVEYLKRDLRMPSVPFDTIEPYPDDTIAVQPCPFCGYRPCYEDPDFCYPSHPTLNIYRAHCVECAGGCCATAMGDSVASAIEAWNRRPEGVKIPKRLPMEDWEMELIDSVPITAAAKHRFLICSPKNS